MSVGITVRGDRAHIKGAAGIPSQFLIPVGAAWKQERLLPVVNDGCGDPDPCSVDGRSR